MASLCAYEMIVQELDSCFDRATRYPVAWDKCFADSHHLLPPLCCHSSSVQVVVKIFTRVLVPDVEYKTLSINRTTTCREVIGMLLQKCRLRDRDPNLFFLTIDVWIRKTGIPIRSVMVLDEKTCPAQLQSVYPQQGTKFTLQMRRGGFLRCDDSCLTSSAVSPSSLSSPALQSVASTKKTSCLPSLCKRK